MKVENNIAEYLSELDGKFGMAFEAVGMQAESHAKMYAPVDTGAFRRSITRQADSQGTVIGAGIEYAIFQKLGTYKMRAHPFLGPAVQNHLAEYKSLGKYIYVDVCFLNSKHPYTYRTNDSSITVNTVVMVPAGKEIKPAIVTGVRTYRENDVPVPPEKLKEVIGCADRAKQKLFKDVDMRKPMDISVKTVRTTKGHAVVVTDDAERKQLREQFKKRKDIRIVETQPASKAYSIVSRDDAGKPIRRGYWKMQEHIDGNVTWKCSRCKAVFYNREAFCPKCHSENRKVSHDPAWIDEIEGFDAFMD